MKRYQTLGSPEPLQVVAGPSFVALVVEPETVISAAPRVMVVALVRLSFTGAVVVHEPAEQLLPALQARPQPPQFAGSALVSTQAPLQRVRPEVHTHAPAVQVWLAAQARPQLPQFEGSALVSTQLPLQRVRPEVHTQTPPVQVWLGAHSTPQPPQLAVSVLVFTQVPPHIAPGAVQVQVPPTQAWIAEQVTPQTPQLLRSLEVSTQLTLPPVEQRIPGAGQVSTQAPAMHASVDAQR